MPNRRDVSYIKSRLLRPALTSHFEVELAIPGGGLSKFLEQNGASWTSENQIRLKLMCSEATLPGSNLATLEINNDFTGVTERHAYRRIYDDRIDLTFYVDAENYLPIKFFESWMKYIVDESIAVQQESKGVGSKDFNYFYRVRYPEGDNGYAATGLKVIKFEKDYKNNLVYEFIKSYPISVSSMPVSYESSSLLKCSVSMTYIRYVILGVENIPNESPNQTTNSNFNLTAEQAAQINSQAFNPNLDLSSVLGNQTTTGGVNFSSAQASGNSINVRDAYSGNFTLNG